jgi:hypothetical protein
MSTAWEAIHPMLVQPTNMLVHEKAKSNNDQKTVNISIEEE